MEITGRAESERRGTFNSPMTDAGEFGMQAVVCLWEAPFAAAVD